MINASIVECNAVPASLNEKEIALVSGVSHEHNESVLVTAGMSGRSLWQKHHIEINEIADKKAIALNGFKQLIRTDCIACIGAGYVGGPTMAVLAVKCPHLQIYVLDVDKKRIADWNSDTLPIYEPGLDELVKRCRGVNLHFSTNVSKYIEMCDIIFVCVSTPTKMYGNGAGSGTDLRAWESAARAILMYSTSPKIIIEKSTVPVKASDALLSILKSHKSISSWCVLSNPEFMSEGTAIMDLTFPERVLLGGPQTAIGKFSLGVLTDIYKKWVPEDRILCIDTCSSELSKLVTNAFLAQRISSINSIAMLCEEVGADIENVSTALGMDSRIGSKFLKASVGFGGSCFRKDLLSLAYICERKGLFEVASYWRSVLEINQLQKERFSYSIISSLFNNVNGKRICILGFSFKKDTADVRDTSGVHVCNILMKDQACLYVYDPKVNRQSALQQMKQHCDFTDATYDSQFFFTDNPQSAVTGASAIAVLTEWDEFKTYNYELFYQLMDKPAMIFDGRNILDRNKLFQIGFNVHAIGHSDLSH